MRYWALKRNMYTEMGSSRVSLMGAKYLKTLPKIWFAVGIVQVQFTGLSLPRANELHARRMLSGGVQPTISHTTTGLSVQLILR